MHLAVGARLGPYEVEAPAGSGGMGVVYRARDTRLDRLVALKLLLPRTVSDPHARARFEREAKIVSQLDHPHICTLFDVGTHEGMDFLVMEYVDGLTLRDVIRRQGQMVATRAAEIGADIAAALHFAHVGGVIHRDVKPGNVLITSSQVKVTDFGIARAGDPAESLTQAGAVMGTATYFSPEQAQGHVVDPRTDVYSLGVVLYEMVAGRPPFTGDNPVSIAYQHVREDPVPLSRHNPDVPPAFEAIVAKAMAKNRANRYSSAEELRADLLRFNQGQTVAAAPLPPAVALTGVMAPAVGPATAPPVDPTRIQSSIDGTRVVTPGDTLVHYEDRPRARTSTYIIILVVLLALLGALLFLVGRQLGVGGAEEVTVPQLIGLNETEADRRLREAGLKPQRREVPDEVNPLGQVVGQDPLANTQVRRGATVVISVSSGAPIIEVPDVRNRTFDAAREALLAAGFRVGPANQVNSDKEPNTVLDQAPAAGSRQPKGSNITLTVSKGVEQIPVPNVRGRSQSDAANLLGQAGFRTTSRTEASSDFDVGEVIRTDPASGTPLERNSVVTLIVSSGPAPTTTQPPATAPPTTPPPTLLPTITVAPTTTSTTRPRGTTTTEP